MKTCIVIPCYNEARRLPTDEYLDFLHRWPHTLLFVDDGSTDSTLEVLGKIQAEYPARALVVSVPKNGGKAEAVRFGMLKALEMKRFDVLGFLDSDLATPLHELARMISYAAAHDHYRMIMAIRLKRLGSKVNRTLKRHYLGRVFATAVSILLHLPTYDTQCGAKLLMPEVAALAFRDPFTSPWFFDVEILFRIRNEKGKDFALHRIYEYPIMTWDEVKGSKLGLSNYLKAPFELLRIWLRYR